MSQFGLPAFPPFVEIDQNPGPQWGKWLGRFERLMIAMGITESRRQRALLLHYAGPRVDEIFDTLSDVGEDTDYDKAVDALNKYFNPKSNSLYETYVFRQAKQENNESLDQFVTRLRQLAQKCKFHDIDREILTQVIMNCASPKLRRQALCKGEDLTLQRLLEIGRSLEASEQQADALEGSSVNSIQSTCRGGKGECSHQSDAQEERTVNSIQSKFRGRNGQRTDSRGGRSQSRGRDSSRSCYFCGGQYPHKGQCPASGQECRSCHKMGHFEHVCHSRRENPNTRKPDQSKRVNQIEESDPSDDDYAFAVGEKQHVAYNVNHLPVIEVYAGQTKVKAVIDSGATVNILDEETYQMLRNTQTLHMSKPKSQIYPYGSNTPLTVKGVIRVELHSNSESCQADFHVVQAKGNLLSYATASKLKLITIDSVVEGKIKSCLPCQAAQTDGGEQTEPLKTNPLPEGPWQEVSADFLGPLPTGEYLLVIIDEYSQFPEVEMVTSTSSKTILPALDAIFARQGIPITLKTDNGPPFNSHEFAEFASHLGFIHRKVTPRANGAAERFNRALLKVIKTAHTERRSWKQQLFRFLRQYRATPHSTTNVSPSHALNGRELKCELPTITTNNANKQLNDMQNRDDEQKRKMKEHANRELKSKESSLKEGDSVLVRQPRRSKASSPFDPHPLKVVHRMGNTISARRGNREIKRNVSCFKKVNARVDPQEEACDDFNEFTDAFDPDDDHAAVDRRPRPILRDPLRRSGRQPRMPVRFQDYVVYSR